MKIRDLRAFAEKIIREAAMIAETFDGTIGDGGYRNRVATCFYATRIFQSLTGMTPNVYLEQVKDDESL